MTRCLIDFLKKHDVEYSEAFDISRLSSIGIGGKASVAAMPNCEEKFIKLIDFLNDNNILYKLAGRMSNILPSDADYDGVLILTQKYKEYCVAENELLVECGAKLSQIILSVSDINLGGMEELFGIPGSVGGMVYGNAGAYGRSVSDFFISAKVYSPTDKKTFVITASDMEFSYRNSLLKNTDLILLSSRFSLVEIPKSEIKKRLAAIISARKSTQPYSEKSLGSIFKRNRDVPISLLIDRLGLKGLRVGGAEVSKKHAGFIVNTGGATARDVKELISIIKNKIYSAYGISAEEEIEIFA